jgi:hypothetical protein
MRTVFNKSSKTFLRTLELTGGISVALLGLFIFLRIAIKDASLDATIKLSDQAVVFVMLAVPGLCVLVGSYVHSLHRKHWAAALAVIGGAVTLFVMGINARLAFILSGDIWGQYTIYMDLILVIITIGTAVTNIVVPDRIKQQEN